MVKNEIVPVGGEIVIYKPEDSDVKLDVRVEDETVWLSQQQMAQLFDTTKQNISLHISNIFKENELEREVVVKYYLTTTQHGAQKGKIQNARVMFYNLDVIISVGYRIRSVVGTRFRQWANQVIKSYLLNGYSYSRHLIALQQQMDSRFTALESRLDEQEQQVDFLVRTHQQPDEKLFNNGCVWDAYSYFAALIHSAKESVILIDNYCDAKTLTLLDNRSDGVSCTIHTTFNSTIEDALEKHNAQCRPIARVQLPKKIHDRFLIIDRQVYLMGNSLKDMGHTLSAAILTGFTPEEVMEKLK